jgi:hypothetical protein
MTTKNESINNTWKQIDFFAISNPCLGMAYFYVGTVPPTPTDIGHPFLLNSSMLRETFPEEGDKIWFRSDRDTVLVVTR